MLRRFFLCLAVLACPFVSFAQWPGWQAHTSMRSATDLAASADAIWAATTGGIFRYDPATETTDRFTTVEGLHAIDAQAIAYDAGRDAVWIGYADGVLDRLDVETGSVTAFRDIARATQFTARGVQHLGVQGDTLLVGTDFGLVIFDAVKGEVRDGITRFGALDTALPVRDAIAAPLPDGRAGLWVATSAGVAYAPLAHPNLREPGAWTVEATQLPSSDVYALAAYDNGIWVGTALDGARRNADGTWPRRGWNNGQIVDLVEGEEGLYAADRFGVSVVTRAGPQRRHAVGDYLALRALTVGPEGKLWLADRNDGVARLPAPLEGTVTPNAVVVPEGPAYNLLAELTFGPDGTLWAAGAPISGALTGVYAFDPVADTWKNYTARTVPELAGTRTYDRIHVTDDGTVWAGTEGFGVVAFDTNGGVVRYNHTNSTLAAAPSTASYVRVGGVDTDREGRVWVTNQRAFPPLTFFDGETWGGLPTLPETGLSNNETYDKLMIDSYGQKWITTIKARGLIVWDTGTTPGNRSDDRHTYLRELGSGGVGLPNTQVNVVTEDRSGRVWIGTDRGWAFFFAPNLVTSGDPNVALPVWPRASDAEAFFLRDLKVNDIEVDPADRKWVASTDGAWLTNPEGNAAIEHLTTENSPLFSNVISTIAVDPTTGRVYFATDRGLLSRDGTAVKASARVEELFVFPNPVRFGVDAERVTIDGLVDGTDLRIVTTDGQLVASFATRGGRAVWDGRDQAGQRVPSGVYVVMAVGQNGEGVAYGRIAVVR